MWILRNYKIVPNNNLNDVGILNDDFASILYEKSSRNLCESIVCLLRIDFTTQFAWFEWSVCVNFVQILRGFSRWETIRLILFNIIQNIYVYEDWGCYKSQNKYGNIEIIIVKNLTNISHNKANHYLHVSLLHLTKKIMISVCFESRIIIIFFFIIYVCLESVQSTVMRYTS